MYGYRHCNRVRIANVTVHKVRPCVNDRTQVESRTVSSVDRNRKKVTEDCSKVQCNTSAPVYKDAPCDTPWTRRILHSAFSAALLLLVRQRQQAVHRTSSCSSETCCVVLSSLRSKLR